MDLILFITWNKDGRGGDAPPSSCLSQGRIVTNSRLEGPKERRRGRGY